MSLPGFESVLVNQPGVPPALWDSPRADWGNAGVQLRVHDVQFRWTGVKSRCLEGLHLQAPLPVKAPVRRVYRFHVHHSRWPQFNNRHYSGLEYTIMRSVDGPRVHFNGYYFAAVYDQASRTAQIRFADAQPEVEAMELANCMRLTMGLVLASERILLLHSSAVSLDGDTWVFFGPEGAGKTTLADLAPARATVFGDDLNALVLRQGKISVSSLPFGSSRTRNVSGSVPVTGCLRILKRPTFGLQSMTPATQSAALLGSIPFLNRDAGLTDRVLPLIRQVTGQVPVCGLGFARSPEVYRWLRANCDSLRK